jgi:adenosylcobinamide kinase / adenosylcobinamide-phosphate guanylyltransferase
MFFCLCPVVKAENLKKIAKNMIFTHFKVIPGAQNRPLMLVKSPLNAILPCKFKIIFFRKVYKLAEIILVTGGCRSGKSSYALRLAESQTGRRLFIATCPVLDEEMNYRIERHKAERAIGGWSTLEEETNLAGAIRGARDFDCILVDCLTLWINNLMYHANNEMNEDEMKEQTLDIIEACNEHSGRIIFVSNEVGFGIVPEHPEVRRYRDLVGRANQTLGTASSRLILVVCGVPVNIKGQLANDTFI